MLYHTAPMPITMTGIATQTHPETEPWSCTSVATGGVYCVSFAEALPPDGTDAGGGDAAAEGVASVAAVVAAAGAEAGEAAGGGAVCAGALTSAARGDGVAGGAVAGEAAGGAAALLVGGVEADAGGEAGADEGAAEAAGVAACAAATGAGADGAGGAGLLGGAADDTGCAAGAAPPLREATIFAAAALPSAVMAALSYVDFQWPVATTVNFAPRSKSSPDGCFAAISRASSIVWQVMHITAQLFDFFTESTSPVATACGYASLF